MPRPLNPVMHDNDEPWHFKMQRVVYHALRLTRAFKRQPLLQYVDELEAMLETELVLLQTYGEGPEDAESRA